MALAAALNSTPRRPHPKQQEKKLQGGRTQKTKLNKRAAAKSDQEKCVRKNE
jgi:hypothetical protein